MASNRLHVLRTHMCSDSISDNLELELNVCNGKSDDNSDKDGDNDNNTKESLPTITYSAIEQPNTLVVDDRIPRLVSVFPVFSRPVFPHVKITAAPKPQTPPTQFPPSNTNNSFKWILEKLKENQTKTKPIKPSDKKQIVYLNGPIVFTDKAIVEALCKLKSGGENHVALCLAKTKDGSKVDDLYQVGVLANIGTIDSSKPSGVEVELTAVHRIVITSVVKPVSAENPFMRAQIKQLKSDYKNTDTKLSQALLISVISKVNQLAKLNHPLFQPQLQLLTYKINEREPSELADLCASLSNSSAERLQLVLEELNVVERLKKVFYLLSVEMEVCLLLERSISHNEARKMIPSASSRVEKNVEEFREKLKGLNVPTHAMKVIDEEISKLQTLDPTHHEHYTSRNYLNWLTSLPWGVFSEDTLDVEKTEIILDEDHYGMQDVKRRISEFIAISSLKSTLQGKILCMVGPPGVGKTSIGKSIARATNRKFFRFSVGGMNDAAEIKGHRRTYIGAMPGKFIQCLKQVKTSNPVILIDEVDKISRNWDGDPASALLEALDPEQNNSFLDNYLDVSFDLSKVLFICTANTTDTIPRPLLDRMEIISLGGYFLDEKLNIATKHLIPHLRKESGLKEENVMITENALRLLIGSYCREAGVRSLQKQLEKVFRKVAYKVAKGEKNTITISDENLETFAGKPIFRSEKLYDSPPPGVVTGLAYNTIGGSLIWIETVVTKAQSEKKKQLQTTGKLGDVMKESTEIAYTFAKNFLTRLEPNNTFFEENTLHMHFPEGGISKDGPSAGCAIVTSFLSVATSTPVMKDLAMTGEISLTGKVLPVGGIKEKTMAAKRSHITTLIFPEANKRDVDELPELLKEGITIHYASSYVDVFKIAFPNVSSSKL